jgi:predicted nucleic acid-binding Zn ribbon protein
LHSLEERLAPASTLAAVQQCWERVVGESIAVHARPRSARSGELEIVCDEAVWAAELELMGPRLVSALNAAIGRDELRSVRVRAGGRQAPSRNP